MVKYSRPAWVDDPWPVIPQGWDSDEDDDGGGNSASPTHLLGVLSNNPYQADPPAIWDDYPSDTSSDASTYSWSNPFAEGGGTEDSNSDSDSNSDPKIESESLLGENLGDADEGPDELWGEEECYAAALTDYPALRQAEQVYSAAESTAAGVTGVGTHPNFSILAMVLSSVPYTLSQPKHTQRNSLARFSNQGSGSSNAR
jgi:hypothetical protein